MEKSGNHFLGIVPQNMQTLVKCVTPVIPRATNAIFQEEATGELIYKNNEDDVSRPEGENGHVSSSSGDSGGPYWMRNDDAIAILVALHIGNTVKYPHEEENWYGNDPNRNCRSRAIKLTKDMRDWLYTKDYPYQLIIWIPFANKLLRSISFFLIIYLIKSAIT